MLTLKLRRANKAKCSANLKCQISNPKSPPPPTPLPGRSRHWSGSKSLPRGPGWMNCVASKGCQDYGVRVQKSVFEGQVGRTERVQLEARLLREIKHDEDSLRFYHLDANAVQRSEHHGVDKPIDLTKSLIL
jgi:CRISPR-associated protein Cas2